jgi:hypothetical protein
MLISSGLEAHMAAISRVDNELYAANTIDSFMLSSTMEELKKNSKDLIGHLFDVKVGKGKIDSLIT